MITAPTEFSGLQVWLDASDTTSLFQLSGGTTAVAANLDPVGYWGDKSGNNRHFLNNAGTTASRPTWVSSLSSLRFDGTNDYLSSFFNITYTAQTVFVVVSQRVQQGNARIYTQVSSGGADTTQTGHYVPCITTTTTSYGSYIGGALRSTVTPRSLSAFEVFTSTQSSVSAINFLNGVAGSAFGSTINYTVALSRLGAAATTATGYFNGDISEVIVYNRALTNNERADVEYYLTRKWNFLNSIPRQTYAIKNGLWSDSATWSISAEPSPWNFPLSDDNAYTNTFTVTADSSTKVDTIRNSTLAPNILSGGSFWLANGVSLSANMAATVTPLISSFVSTNSEIIGINATTNSSVTHIIHTGTGNLLLSGSSFVFGTLNNNPFLRNIGTGNCKIIGNISGGTNNVNSSQIANVSSGRIEVVGNVQGVNYYPVILNNSTGSIYLTGSSTGSTNTFGSGINNTGGGYVFVDGTVGSYSATSSNNAGVNNSNGRVDILGTVAPAGLNVTGSASTSITGDVISTNNYGSAFSTSTTPLSVYGNIINAPNGRQAIYAPRYQVFPSASATYTRQAVNGYDSYVDYWTSDATFTYPASSDVVLSTVYSNNTLSGSMALPPASAVALGASVGTTTGTASITLEGLLNQPVATLNTPNSIGARLKNVATTQALSAVANSLDFNN